MSYVRIVPDGSVYVFESHDGHKVAGHFWRSDGSWVDIRCIDGVIVRAQISEIKSVSAPVDYVWAGGRPSALYGSGF